jgi:hypothetical protein
MAFPSYYSFVLAKGPSTWFQELDPDPAFAQPVTFDLQEPDLEFMCEIRILDRLDDKMGSTAAFTYSPSFTSTGHHKN